MVKFLVVGDLHGDVPKLLTKDFDAIIAPGDFCGDEIRPYILKYLKKAHKTDEEIDFDDFCPPEKQEKLEKLSIEKGRKVLEYLNSQNKPVFVVPGNWDPTEYQDGEKKKDRKGDWDEMLKGLENVIDVESKKHSFKGLDLIGHGSTSSPEPLEELDFPEPLDQIPEVKKLNRRVKFFTKKKEHIENIIDKSKNPIILITHNVPYDTDLDKVFNPGTSVHGKHLGSVIARDIIDTRQPILSIGGHIHEGHGETKLKNTICVNAGFGGRVNTIIEIDPKSKKVLSVEFLGVNKKNIS